MIINSVPQFDFYLANTLYHVPFSFDFLLDRTLIVFTYRPRSLKECRIYTVVKPASLSLNSNRASHPAFTYP